MCNRQAWIIVVTTVTISVLLVATAILVYHYIIPQQVQNIPGLHTLVNLPQYNDIDFDSCKCQKSEENCAKEIKFKRHLQEQKEDFCTEDKILCCKLKENFHWDRIIYEDNHIIGNEPNKMVTIQEKEEIEDLEVFVNEFFNELSLSKEIESSNCRCRHPKVKCGKQIHVPQSLQSQLIYFCPDTYIICCDIEDQPKIKKGSIEAAYGDTGPNMNSYNKNNTKLDENGFKFDHLLNQSMENLTELKERNETIFSNIILEMHNLENVNVGLEELTEENQLKEDNISDSKNSMHSIGTNNILHDITGSKNTEKNKGKNKDDTGSTIDENIEKNKNEYDSRNHTNNKYVDKDENIKSLIDINLIRKTYNDKIKNKLEELSESFNSIHNKHDTLVANIDKEDSDHCSGNECIHSEQDENKNVFMTGFDHTDKDYTLFDMMNEMGMFNETLDDFKEVITNLSRYENFENLEDDTINSYSSNQDGDLCSGDDCIQNDQEENKNLSNVLKSNSMGQETESKTNFSNSEVFDFFAIEEDIGFLLPNFEQDNDNSTSVTLYTSDNTKSRTIKDHIFYYSYLTAFLYVVGFLVDFLIPVFSLAGLAVLQLLIFAFPKIIQSQIFDILSPLLGFMYRFFGLL